MFRLPLRFRPQHRRRLPLLQRMPAKRSLSRRLPPTVPLSIRRSSLRSTTLPLPVDVVFVAAEVVVVAVKAVVAVVKAAVKDVVVVVTVAVSPAHLVSQEGP
jgi:hypothetical protein